MICLDCETTALLVPEAAPIEQQPYITELAAIKLEDRYRPGAKKGESPELVEVSRLEFLCRPRIPIPPDAVKITGITNEMVAKQPPFSKYLIELIEFFLGERTVVAHNWPYDGAVLRYELQRLGKVTGFPWPPIQVCTVELTVPMKGYRMNLGDLHQELVGQPHKDAHRAIADTEALVRIVKVLRKKGLL